MIVVCAQPGARAAQNTVAVCPTFAINMPSCGICFVMQVARWTFENGMGTLMLQAGELPNPSRLAYLQEVVSKIIKETVAMDLERRGLDPNVRWRWRGVGNVRCLLCRHLPVCQARKLSDR